uniref:Uncharacterized protein n=1 Tax=Setaria digitata TaxID=48799 RepID=A0A915PJ83_9BILA
MIVWEYKRRVRIRVDVERIYVDMWAYECVRVCVRGRIYLSNRQQKRRLDAAEEMSVGGVGGWMGEEQRNWMMAGFRRQMDAH